jgi:hypothetical protein
VSAEVQTSPKRDQSPDKYRHIKHTTSVHTKIAETESNTLEESFKTIKINYDAAKMTAHPRYEGETLRGFRHGFGKYYFEDGGYYEGQWTFNRMQGKGKLFYASGKIAYEGM